MKKNGNMYNFIDVTWNPLAGECPHGCIYCSTKKMKRFAAVKEKYSGEIRVDKDLRKRFKNKTLFICGQNDLFADRVPDYAIIDILKKANEMEGNKYFFQTKNPKRIIDFVSYIPKNSIISTTIETNRDKDAISVSKAPSPSERAAYMRTLSITYETHITIEPIMDFDLEEFSDMIFECRPNQVNIGANTFKKISFSEPDRDKLNLFVRKINNFAIVNVKDNLKRLL